MANSYINKKVIIAGSEGLIGSMICKEFSKLGATVISLDLKTRHDLSDEAFVKEIMNSHDKANVLITPFAINPQPNENEWNLFNFPLESLKKYLDVNLLALFSVCREFARTCADGASIINFSSIYGVNAPKHFIYSKGYEKHIGYTITKAGVIGMGKYLATYLAPRVRVNTIVPGGVANNQDPEFVKNYQKMVPMKRMMVKEELLGIIKYLASDESSYTTGGIFPIDGGWTSW